MVIADVSTTNGTTMSRPHPRHHGEGTAWLVSDRRHGAYQCYWYTGSNDGRLREHASVTTAADAVAWGRLRTRRVRIRTDDARTLWAGTAPRPTAFAATWTDAHSPNAT